MTGLNIARYLHPELLEEPKPKDQVTQDQEDEILEAFLLYDEEGKGFLSIDLIGTAMRSLGYNITVREEKCIQTHFMSQNQNEIDFKTFLKIMKEKRKPRTDNYELLETFRKFDQEENGWVNLEKLKEMLTTMGEPLTNDELNEWLDDGEEFSDENKLFYEDFATFMLSK